MNHLFQILSLAILACLLVALVPTWAKGFRNARNSPRVASFLTFAFHAPLGFINSVSGAAPLALANIAEGTHDGMTTKLADGAYGRHLLVKTGSDADHVALAGVADIPIGIIDDESAAAEDPLNMILLGSIRRTVLLQSSAAAIAKDAFVVAAANGQARTLPAVTGTYYIIGRAMNATAGTGGINDLVEIDPMPPIQRVVP